MAFTTRVKTSANAALGLVNLRIDSLTVRRAEERRLAALERAAWFDRPVFPVPEAFRNAEIGTALRSLKDFESRFDSFADPARNDVGFSLSNSYFGSPDAEVLYSTVRALAPRRVVEVGSGNSTKLIRQAVLDGGLRTEIVSIDPAPRTDVRGLADRVIASPVEEVVGRDDAFACLGEGDVLFIDSSHIVAPGNDCVALYLNVVPALARGVVIHVHDIFLPYEYPRNWIDICPGWNEQYLVQAMLAAGDAFEVLWPGHYLQRTRPEFPEWFPRAGTRPATSLWLRKAHGPVSPAA